MRSMRRPNMASILVPSLLLFAASISSAAQTLLTTVTTGNHPTAVAVNTATNKIYVANQNSNSVTVVDGLSYHTQTVAVGSNPGALAINPVTDKIYIANQSSNTVIVPAGAGGAVAVYANKDTQLVGDINGYFAAPGTGGLSLYTLMPCRVFDTRSNGGGGAFSGVRVPPVNVEGSFCAVPASAQSYVFNATVVPVGSLGFLTLWADPDPWPGASTLNAPDGYVTSNMAIVGNHDGKTAAEAAGSATQLILDIASYFAP